MQPNNPYRIDRSDSILEDAFEYFDQKLPLPFLQLQNQIRRLPPQLSSPEIQQSIHSKNKQIILEHFHQLSVLTANVFIFQSTQKQQNLGDIIQKLQKSVFGDYPHNGKFYGSKINRLVRNINLQDGHTKDTLELILRALGRVHYENYELDKIQNHITMTQVSKYQISIPEKFQSQIQTILDQYFGKPLADRQVQEREEADMNAKSMRQIFFHQGHPSLHFTASKVYPDLDEYRKSYRKSHQLQRSDSSFKMTTSKIIEQPDQFPQQQISSENDYQDNLNNLVLAIEKSQQNKQPFIFKTEIPAFLLEDYEKKKLLNYYEQYTMIHFAKLMLSQSLDQPQFTLSNVKGNPYLKILEKQIQVEKSLLRSEFQGLQMTLCHHHTKNNKKIRLKQPPKRISRKPSPDIKRKTGMRENVKNFLGKIVKEAFNPHQQEDPQYIKEKRPIQQQFQEYQRNLEIILSQISPKTQHYHILGNTDFEDLKYYHEKQSWIIIIIFMYWKFIVIPEKNQNIRYTPTRRRILVNILKRVCDKKRKPKPEFLNWPFVLKYLQNNRPEITVMTNNEVIKKSEQILKQLYQNLVNHDYLKTMNDNIFEGGLENFQENLPMLKLICLSKGKNKKESSVRCKVVHILISGFLSQDSDKHDQWADMVDTMPGCEIYALVWESNTIKNLVLFLMKSAKDLLTAEFLKQELQKKYVNNPFVPAFEVAKITGRLLAELVVRLFPNQFVSLCGYSLGSEVIKQFLSRMIQSNHQGMIYNIKMMGGVSDSVQFEDIISQSKTSISISNCITKHDGVLRHILSLVKPDLKPMGIYPIKQIQGHFINNVNCNKVISGHLKYRSNMDIMGKILEMSFG